MRGRVVISCHARKFALFDGWGVVLGLTLSSGMVFLDSHSTEALLFSPSLALSIVALSCCDGSPGLPPRFTRAFGHRTRGTNATVGSHCSKSIQAITANDGPLVIVYKQERGAPHARIENFVRGSSSAFATTKKRTKVT